MMSIDIITAIITSALASAGLFSFLQFLINRNDKRNEAIRCLLRSELLKIYCHNRDNKKIKQYARENADKLHSAYKALNGNSFVDDMYGEIREFEIEK